MVQGENQGSGEVAHWCAPELEYLSEAEQGESYQVTGRGEMGSIQGIPYFQGAAGRILVPGRCENTRRDSVERQVSEFEVVCPTRALTIGDCHSYFCQENV
jgi:hypothetical protein